MNDVKPIALCGRMRSGKDTVAEYLVDNYGYTRFAFGDSIRKFAHEIFPWIPTDPKPRELYQFFNVMREYDSDVWIRHCFENIRRESSVRNFCGKQDVYPVISDLRQPNELARCRAEGYVIIRVNCADSVRIARMKASGDVFNRDDLTHDTESHSDTFDVDYDVSNDGNIDHTYEQIDDIMRSIGGN